MQTVQLGRGGNRGLRGLSLSQCLRARSDFRPLIGPDLKRYCALIGSVIRQLHGAFLAFRCVLMTDIREREMIDLF